MRSLRDPDSLSVFRRTLNAGCKAFQTWRALLATLLRLELDMLKVLAKAKRS